MHKILEELMMGFDLRDDIIKDSLRLLRFHHKDEVAEHSQKVALEAEKLAFKFRVQPEKALTAGFLHDLGNIIAWEDMELTSSRLSIELLPEEKIFPAMLHQKLSKIIAKEIIGVNDFELLNAVECHSTLRRNPGKLDMILFIADKMQWDEEHKKPYIAEILNGLEISLEKGVLAYLRYGYAKFNVLHPWFLEAYNSLNSLI